MLAYGLLNSVIATIVEGTTESGLMDDVSTSSSSIGIPLPTPSPGISFSRNFKKSGTSATSSLGEFVSSYLYNVEIIIKIKTVNHDYN